MDILPYTMYKPEAYLVAFAALACASVTPTETPSFYAIHELCLSAFSFLWPDILWPTHTHTQRQPTHTQRHIRFRSFELI